MAVDLLFIVRQFRRGFYWLWDHAITEMDADGIRTEDLEEAIGRDRARVIEDYPDDPRGARCLILGWAGPREPLHIAVQYDEPLPNVVTAYRPNPRHWYPGFQRRRPRR